MDISKTDMDDALAYYESQHTTPGCKITHMLGVPLILVSLVTFLCGARRTGVALFGLGAVLQIAGHLIFEKNKPIFVKRPSNLLNYTSAIIFVAREWAGAFKKCLDCGTCEKQRKIG